MGGSSKKQTVGYRYYMALHFALCYGPIDRLRRLIVGERVAWSGGVEENAAISVDAPNLFGGESREGGIQGTGHALLGGASQVLPAAVSAALPSPAPGFRGIFSFFFDGLVSSNNPYIKPFAFQLTRILSGWSGGAAWYPEKAPIEVAPDPDGDAGYTYTDGTTSVLGSRASSGSGVSLGTGAFVGSEFQVLSGQWLTTYPDDPPVEVVGITPSGVVRLVRTFNLDGRVLATHNNGVSDEPCLVARAYGSPTTIYFFNALGARSTFTTPVSVGGSGACFFKQGGDIFFGGPVDGTNRVYKYAASGGAAPVATSPSLPTSMNCIGGDADHLFVVGRGATTNVYVLSRTDLSLVRTITGPTEFSTATWRLIDNRVGRLQLFGLSIGLAWILNPDDTFTAAGSVGGALAKDTPSAAVLDGDVYTVGQTEPNDVPGTLQFHRSLGTPLPDVFVAMNPAHMVYQCKTDADWGMGYPTATIDAVDFAAAADTLFAEGFGLCMQWTEQEEIGAFVQRVCDHAGGIVYADPKTGLFRLKLLRADYDPETLEVFDESKVLALESFQRATYGELVNEITVVYRDVATNKDTPIVVQNQAAIEAQGGVVGKTVNYPGLPTAALAARVAERDLRAQSTPLAKGRMKVNRSAWSMTPGGVFKLTWAAEGLSGVVMRVVDLDLGTPTDTAITVHFAEDVFGLPASSYIAQEPSGWQEPDAAPQPITDAAMVEVPYVSIVSEFGADLAEALDEDAAFFAATASRPTLLSTDLDIWARVGAAPFEQAGSGAFVPGAVLAGAIGAGDTSVPLEQGVDLSQVEVGDLAIIGTGRAAEWVLVDGIDLEVLSITVSRGVLDTTPQEHAAGAAVFFDDARAAADQTERATGETVDFKLAPTSTGGTLDYAGAATLSATADQRQARPYAPGNTLINGVMFPASVLGTITVTWAHRNRLQQTAGIVLQSEGSITPELGTTYTLWVYDDETDALLQMVEGIASTSRALVVPTGSLLRVELAAVRGGLESWQRQVRRFAHTDGLLMLENGDVLTMEQGQLASQESAPPDTSGLAHRATFTLSGSFSADDRLTFALGFNGSTNYIEASAAGSSTLAEFAAAIASAFVAAGFYATVNGAAVHVFSNAAFVSVGVRSAWARDPQMYLLQEAAAVGSGGNQWTFIDLYNNPGVGLCPQHAAALGAVGLAQVSFDVYPRRVGAAPIAGGSAFPGGGAARRFSLGWYTLSGTDYYLTQIAGLADEINGSADLAALNIAANTGSLAAPPPPDTPITRAAVVIVASGDYGVDVNGQFAGGYNGTPISPWPLPVASHPSGYVPRIAQWADLGVPAPAGLPQISAFTPRPAAGSSWAAGQTWFVTLDGTEYAYTLTGADDTVAEVEAGLDALIGASFTLSVSGDQVLIERAAVDTAFTASVWASYGVRVAATIDS